MSFIIKGIDLPKGTDGLSITFHSQYGVMETHILDVTQAIQIPKGHGRLIDADALFKDLKEQQIPFNSDINSAILVAPTILEGEEE